MRTLLNKIGVSFVLLALAAAAHAGPWGRWEGHAPKNYHPPSRPGWLLGQEGQGASGGSGQSGPQGQQAQGADARGQGPDDPRRQSRLSPEERRELRRQINEAGRDVYGRRPNP